MHRKSLAYSGLALLFCGSAFAYFLRADDPRAFRYPFSSRSFEPWGYLVWITGNLLAVGVLLVLKSAISAESPDQFTPRAHRIFPELKLANLSSWHRHSPIPLISDARHFGPVLTGVLMTLLFIFVIFEVGARHSLGLRVDLLGRINASSQPSPWRETLGVYVDSQRRFLVNGQLIPRDQLRAKLQEELGKRAVWVVYLEADNDSLYMDAIYAMDSIQGLGAKLIWITPKMREELNRTPPR